ncbi:MAG: NAD(P)-dependent alcohol dehydrogenase [Actinomycetota bacterium]|nr:MAG: NAD(P)-dependent alcohol dehydrogenase [Actinomycetota bacterium]
MDVTAYAVASATSPFAKTVIERREPGPGDVLIEISHCGICHSDIHTARDEWGGTRFPIVPGHEIVGTVREVGSDVTRHRIGDRVGVGCLVESCRTCDYCLKGEEQFCRRRVGTYSGVGKDGRPTAGGYSTHIVVDEAFVVGVPEGISSAEAAPLLCAGITVYSPLRHWGAGPGKRVAIVGMGGLGHMAVKIASALGADVTVLSQTLSKQADGRSFGARDFRATSDPATFGELRRSFDLILNTVSVAFDVDAYLSLLDVDGALINVGAPSEPVSLKISSLFNGRRTFAASPIGGLPETQEMLDFCAAHGLGAQVEVISADQIDAAYDRVVASDVRYRFVIDAATMG